jgi:hypothetical protein
MSERIQAVETRPFEGTWEEVARHGPKLTGKRVRLTVLGEPQPQTQLDSALAKIIESAETLEVARPPAGQVPLADDWGERVAEKFRRQGFKL